MDKLTDAELDKYIEILDKVEKDSVGLIRLMAMDAKLAGFIGSAEHVCCLRKQAELTLTKLEAEKARRTVSHG